MTEHPYALTLSLLIHAELLQRCGAQGFEAKIAHVLESYFLRRGYTDEKLADLYALLAERLKPNMMHSEMRVVCSACLHLNDEWSRA
jgi:hypothetical protein